MTARVVTPILTLSLLSVVAFAPSASADELACKPGSKLRPCPTDQPAPTPEVANPVDSNTKQKPCKKSKYDDASRIKVCAKPSKPVTADPVDPNTPKPAKPIKPIKCWKPGDTNKLPPCDLPSDPVVSPGDPCQVDGTGCDFVCEAEGCPTLPVKPCNQAGVEGSKKSCKKPGKPGIAPVEPIVSPGDPTSPVNAKPCKKPGKYSSSKKSFCQKPIKCWKPGDTNKLPPCEQPEPPVVCPLGGTDCPSLPQCPEGAEVCTSKDQQLEAGAKKCTAKKKCQSLQGQVR